MNETGYPVTVELDADTRIANWRPPYPSFSLD